MNPSHPLRLLSGRQSQRFHDRDLDPQTLLHALGCRLEDLPGTLPFAAGDLTAGSETELQAVVIGGRNAVDLPLAIEHSGFFANLRRRARAGDAAHSLVQRLEDFLAGNAENVWENSWVRLPMKRLGDFSRRVLERDLLADKSDPTAGRRGDAGRFILGGIGAGDERLRIPVSYLVKLALADHLDRHPDLPPAARATGERLMNHYLSDNTSPETFSFQVVTLGAETGMGEALARETAQRFLFTHLLTCHANLNFGLLETGQRTLIYFAPHPPLRQKQLNDLIPDAFYRELFMSPCLSGWDRGESKHHYMHLCHQVLSRSKLNAVAKLREAGIISNNLVLLPNMSNISLANNGTHISLGSRRLTQRMNEGTTDYGAAEEKCLGDLAVKIQEHFLPLFAGTFSAAPYRVGFEDFHPETALGFLAHELDYTHLRMLWRRWKKKASLSVCGHSLTPFGPDWLDQSLSRLLGLRGDLVPDFRLIDYPVAFLSTANSPALDGRLGNQNRLKADLDAMGVFDRQMSLYQFFKLREHGSMGFTGFEGRHYSLFHSLGEDLGGAAGLQALLTGLAFKYLASGEVRHRHIPDDPVTESERRQIFFGLAVGIPTFYVSRRTRDRFLLKILRRTRQVRVSNRYPGYWRVPNREYRLALLDILVEDGAVLIEASGLGGLLAELRRRLERPEDESTAGRLTRGILDRLGAKNPLKVKAQDFNRAAEGYYRDDLRLHHLREALAFLREDLERPTEKTPQNSALFNRLSGRLLEDAPRLFADACRELPAGAETPETVARLLNLMLLNFSRQAPIGAEPPLENTFAHAEHASVHRAG